MIQLGYWVAFLGLSQLYRMFLKCSTVSAKAGVEPFDPLKIHHAFSDGTCKSISNILPHRHVFSQWLQNGWASADDRSRERMAEHGGFHLKSLPPRSSHVRWDALRFFSTVRIGKQLGKNLMYETTMTEFAFSICFAHSREPGL